MNNNPHFTPPSSEPQTTEPMQSLQIPDPMPIPAPAGLTPQQQAALAAVASIFQPAPQAAAIDESRIIELIEQHSSPRVTHISVSSPNRAEPLNLGRQHHKLPLLLAVVAARVPAWLVGPALFASKYVHATRWIAETLQALPESDQPMGHAQIKFALDRHFSGDWGDTGKDGDPSDWQLNDESLDDGRRIFSVFNLPAPFSRTIWIITDAESDDGTRYSTTVLFPEEY